MLNKKLKRMKQRLTKDKGQQEIRKLLNKFKCDLCNYKTVFDKRTRCFKCECCGAKRLNGKWILICSNCKCNPEKLVGLFVPHLCNTCLTKIREQQIKNKDICSLCNKPYCDCYC